MTFNAYQRDHMRALTEIPADRRCWAGWCVLPDRRDCCSPCPCPIDVTLADNLVSRQSCCERPSARPDELRTSGSHYAGCTMEWRREEIEHTDLGGEG